MASTLQSVWIDKYNMLLSELFTLNEAMMPKSNFSGSDKNKLGPAAHLKGKMKRPARAGDLVGAAESTETRYTSKQEVINHFTRQGKPAAQGAAAWERGWRGPTKKTPKLTTKEPRQDWQFKRDREEDEKSFEAHDSGSPVEGKRGGQHAQGGYDMDAMRLATGTMESDHNIDEISNPEDDLFKKQLMTLLNSEVAKKLNKTERYILYRAFMDGVDEFVIAKEVQRPPNLIRIAISRILHKLRFDPIKRFGAFPPPSTLRKNVDPNDLNVYSKTKEDAAGVGIITKQNSTVDVNKNTPKKNLKAFRL